MRFIFSLLILSLFSIPSFADQSVPVHFKNGNNREIQELYGDVTFICQDPHNNLSYARHWNCNADLVSPGTHDYLVSNVPLDADRVTLTATHEDGKTKKKSISFDSAKSVSKSRVNLLIRTLTQSPLLRLGKNTVAYQFTKGKTVVNEGSFTSDVTITGSIQCRHRTEYALNNDVCEFQGIGCDRYFYLENNCQY